MKQRILLQDYLAAVEWLMAPEKRAASLAKLQPQASAEDRKEEEEADHGRSTAFRLTRALRSEAVVELIFWPSMIETSSAFRSLIRARDRCGGLRSKLWRKNSTVTITIQWNRAPSSREGFCRSKKKLRPLTAKL